MFLRDFSVEDSFEMTEKLFCRNSIIAGFDKYEDLMNKPGKYKTGSSCLYLNKLGDVDIKVLTALINDSIKFLNSKYI
ncbi:MAG: hypothetical protein AUK34_15005 [Ignavibacteria bacterium CG2_30_36_16]|nr:MAG: hypothetical protein AUK34_15005 [Ignavibacteria bacterium CG2_30_36_16]